MKAPNLYPTDNRCALCGRPELLYFIKQERRYTCSEDCRPINTAPKAKTPRKLNAAAKGARMERGIVKSLEKAGIKARRQPGSGNIGTRINEDSLTGDVTFTIGDETLTLEAKHRANGEGFKVLEGWLGDNDGLVLKRDRQTPFYVLSESTWLRLVGLARAGA